MEETKKYLPALYKKDGWIDTIFNSGQIKLDELEADAIQLGNELLLNLMSEKQLEVEESLCGISELQENIQDRKAVVSAKWKSRPVVILSTLQAIADSWEDGKVKATYPNAEYVRLEFEKDVKEYQKMLEAIRETMPAHIPLFASVLYSNYCVSYVGALTQIYDNVNVFTNYSVPVINLNTAFVCQIADFVFIS